MTNIKIRKPFVCLLDIETSPIKGYTWVTYDANVLKIIEASQVISVAWKELNDETVKVKCQADYKSYKPGKLDDKELIEDTWKVLDRADVVIAHNGDPFDLKKLAARFVFHGLNAPSAFKSIDTLKAAKRGFKFESNSLNSLGQYLGVGEKLKHSGFDLWLRCIEDGDKAAWNEMKEYNAQDVNLLEKVYLRLRPYISNHPNLSAIVAAEGGDVGISCPSCQSTRVTKRGFSITRTGRRQRYQCGDCGSWSAGPYERIKDMLSPDE